jgi:hypothetical protein
MIYGTSGIWILGKRNIVLVHTKQKREMLKQNWQALERYIFHVQSSTHVAFKKQLHIFLVEINRI